MKNLPIKLYRAAQVREFDRIAIQDYGIQGIDLMTRAGDRVFYCLKKIWQEARSVAVFCGAGNNAGDGYIIANLALAEGFKVCVYAVGETEKLHGAALTAYQKYIDAGGKLVVFQPAQVIEADVLVDALLGTGLDRPVTGLYALAIQAINAHIAPVIAVDIPSGINADTGNVMGYAVKADVSVTFIALKQGLFTGQAVDFCGELYFSQLAVPDQVFETSIASAVRVVKMQLPHRLRSMHKGDCGHVLVIGGELGFSGAVRLAAEAALRVGAGLVSIATRKDHAGFLNLTRPELMVHGIENPEQLTVLLKKADVLVIGPGLGQSDWAKALFTFAISMKKPMVIDADGLNLLALTEHTKPDWILTPHPGEAGRLLQRSTAAIQQDRFAAVSAICAKYGGIAILKGSGTLIASEKQLAISNTGNPGMASGGMGDVLAGVIAGLLAQNLALQDAAEQGVYIHGLAADNNAKKHGERGLLASDVIANLRKLVN